MASIVTFADLYAEMNTDFAPTLSTTPEPVRLVVVASTSISISYGGNTLLLFGLQGGCLLPNQTIATFDPVTQVFTFNVTGYATTCTATVVNGNLTINVAYTGTTGATAERLIYITSSNNYQQTVNYTDIDTSYSLNNGVLSVFSQISTGKQISYTMTNPTTIAILSLS